MSLNKTQQKTINYYDENANEWVKTHVVDKTDKLKKFQKLLPKGKIIEIGSGDGLDAFNLIKLGYGYTGTDASKSLIQIAQKRNPKVTFNNIPVEELSKNFNEDCFDGFWTAATLLHIPKNKINKDLQNIHKI